MNLRICSTALIFISVLLSGSSFTRAAEQVVVVVGHQATDLERLAAEELVSQFKRLFDVHVELTDSLPEKHEHLVLVGDAGRNPAIREVASADRPELSEQGFIIRSFDTAKRRGVVVAGGSSAATYWAVCELGHRFGIRYLLREDIYPEKQSLELTGLDVRMEPEFKVRAWKTLGDGVTGPESWSAAEQEKLLRQLAKMKFNHVVLSVQPWQPFVNYTFRDTDKQTAMLWRGEQYPIPRDAPGRTAFGADSMVNLDFAGQQSPDETTTAGIRHVRGIITTAQRLGMSIGLELAPFEFPKDFERTIPGLIAAPGTNGLAVQPGPTLKMNDAALKELVTTQLRAYVKTYPDIDSIYFTLPKSGSGEEAIQSIWESLSKQLGPDAPSWNQPPGISADGSQGVLAEAYTRSIAQQIAAHGDPRRLDLAAGSAMLAELDPTMHYLSRAAWDQTLTARSSHDDLFTTITGSQAIADRLWLGFGHIESAATLAGKNDIEFARPAAGMLMKHSRAEPAPEWWQELTDHYTQSMIELYRSHGAAAARARPVLFYYAKRSEYVLDYLACVKAVRAAAIARQDGDADGAIEQLEAAIESLYNAIDTLSDVVQDPSDRGLIAALNAYAYRPLLAEYERLLESE